MDSPLVTEVRVGRIAPLGRGHSAIVKTTVSGRVRLTRLGVEGDQQADTRVHGGPDKAVHLFSRETYAALQAQRPDLDLSPGRLGENLTVTGIDEHSVHPGDVWRVGGVLLQVTQPRRPCWKIDARLGSEGMVGLINQLRTPGWYCRVLEEGEVQAGDRLELVERPAPETSLHALLTAFGDPRPDAALLRRLATIPGLTSGWVERLERRAEAAVPLKPRAQVITVSDRSHRGEREDASGPAAAKALEQAGFTVATRICPDGAEVVAQVLREAVAEGFDVVITSGGTGIGPRDLTPEGTGQVIERELPGLTQLLTTRGLQASPHAALSRGLAGVCGSTLIVNLPGKPKAVLEGLEVLVPLLPHAIDQLHGGDH